MMFILINILLSIFFVESAIILSLNDYAQWYILAQDKNLLNDETLAVKMPNGIYSAIIEDRKLSKDFFIRGFNDSGFRWVGKNYWIYALWFSVDKSILEAPYKEIVFHGIDGIALVVLNDVEMGITENSFVTYRYDVTKILVEGENRLFVKFQPSIGVPENPNMKNLLFSMNVSKWNGEENVNFLRRMQASFGSDFGPAFPSLGLWKDVELIAYQNEIIIRDIAVSTVPYNENWRVEVTLYNESRVYDFDSMKGIFTISFILENDKEIKFSKEIPNNTTAFKEFRFKVSIPKTYVKEWWPNGYGNQNLYELTAIFKSKSCTNEKTIKIGFRTVSLEQNQLDLVRPSLGLSFYFTVNHVPIFVKGANLLPIDIFPEKASDEKTIEYLIRSAKLANMNMLRVNGLGIYQSDYFYQLCDEYGILVWQDMMFSTYVYPDSDSFIKNVSVEITQQIERLQYHPSIIIWVGIADSEIAAKNMLRYNANLSSAYEKSAGNLIRTITEIISTIDRTRPYLPSIPVCDYTLYSGYNRSKHRSNDGYFALREYNDSWLTSYFPIVRFEYEYGVQSFPSLNTLKKVASDEDLSSLHSKFMQHRQHTLDEEGNMRILRFIGYHFGKLKSIDVENVIYISQIEQAWTVKLRTEWLRTWRNNILPSGKGKTMGVLYWHLNDVWQAPTWSSIEYGGKWKILHYYAKKFFSPILVSINTNISGEVTFNLTSDLIEDIKATLKMEIFKWDSMNAISVTTYSVFLEMEAKIVYTSTNLKYIFSSPSCSSKADSYKKNCFLKVTLLGEKYDVLSDNYLFPNYFKDLVGLQDAKIEAKVTSCNSKVCNLLIKTDAIALFVWLDIQDKMGYFSDNGFIMTEPEKEIIFYSENEIEVEEAQSLVTVKILSKSLLDSIRE